MSKNLQKTVKIVEKQRKMSKKRRRNRQKFGKSVKNVQKL